MYQSIAACPDEPFTINLQNAKFLLEDIVVFQSLGKHLRLEIKGKHILSRLLKISRKTGLIFMFKSG